MSKYGEKVLRTPANSGIGLVAWVVPFAALFLGLAGIAIAFGAGVARHASRPPKEDEEIVAAAREATQ